MHIARTPPALVSLGDVFTRLERFDEALSLYREALSHDPLYTRAHIAFAKALVASTVGEGIIYIRSPLLIRHLAYPLLLCPESRVSKIRFLRFPTLIYLRRKLRRTPENPVALFLLGVLALYELQFETASLILSVIRDLPSYDAARAAALVPIAYGLNGDLSDAVLTLDWLIEQERNPTIPVAINVPDVFRQLVRDTLPIPFILETSLSKIE